MAVKPISHYDGPEGHQKIPICQKCFDKAATVFCDSCRLRLCQDCRHTHDCSKKDGKKRKPSKGKVN